jgi:hypothetical protein
MYATSTMSKSAVNVKEEYFRSFKAAKNGYAHQNSKNVVRILRIIMTYVHAVVILTDCSLLHSVFHLIYVMINYRTDQLVTMMCSVKVWFARNGFVKNLQLQN